jgi:FKBP-type peptidyl-prolyl cis-trans isomerase (trigger factor)
MVEGARAELKQRGIKDADKAPIPVEIFTPQAERRVRLGLIVSELVKQNNLQTSMEQIKTARRRTCSQLRKTSGSREVVHERSPAPLRSRCHLDGKQRDRVRTCKRKSRPQVD